MPLAFALMSLAVHAMSLQTTTCACLAQVVAANREAKKTGALLDSDGDTFLKNECKADKWVIVELSQVTKMDTLVLSQVCRVVGSVCNLEEGGCNIIGHSGLIGCLRAERALLLQSQRV